MSDTFSGLLGEGSVVRQFFMWGVAYEVIRNLLQPFFQAELNLIQHDHPEVPLPPADLARLVLLGHLDKATAADEARKSGIDPAEFDLMVEEFKVPLSPAQLADLVLKGWVTQDYGASEAAKSGITAERFDYMVKDTGEPIGLVTALEAYRRGFIPFSAPVGTPSVEEAVKTSRIRDEWLPVIDKLNLVPIPLADVVDALVENQIDLPTAQRIAYENGIDAANLQILFNTRGNPVSPTEAMELVRRGIIPVKGRGPTALTFEQAIYEGATKDKWEPLLEDLIVAYPSAYEVIALANAQVLDQATEHTILAYLGYPENVISAFLQHNSSVKVAGSKQLAVGVVETLYYDQAIDNAQATTFLNDLGYSDTDAAFILQVQDMKRVESNLTGAISKVKSVFVAHKLSAEGAVTALAQLKVPNAQAQQLVNTWEVEVAANVKLPTEAQITDAWEYQIVDEATALGYLEALGYAPYDAWLVLSVKNKGPLGEPPAGATTNLQIG